jgi:hypothetical protein
MQLSKIKSSFIEKDIKISAPGVPHGTLVGVPGVEPGTSSLSGTRSNQLSYTPYCPPRLCRAFCRTGSCGRNGANSTSPYARPTTNGGGNRDRTGDPELAKLVLYQLSYAPSTFVAQPGHRSITAPQHIRRRRPSNQTKSCVSNRKWYDLRY